MKVEFGDYIISDEKDRLKVDALHEMLNRSYWATNRSKEVIEVSIKHSICYGIYFGEQQIGFGRVVTDYATMYWLADVIIHEDHRGKGLGKALMDLISNDSRLEGLLGILATKDAHGLYQKYGFMKDPEKLMQKPRDF